MGGLRANGQLSGRQRSCLWCSGGGKSLGETIQFAEHDMTPLDAGWLRVAAEKTPKGSPQQPLGVGRREWSQTDWSFLHHFARTSWRRSMGALGRRRSINQRRGVVVVAGDEGRKWCHGRATSYELQSTYSLWRNAQGKAQGMEQAAGARRKQRATD